jgi:FlaA1/EpsC-like NDP-sugar epimerase
MLRLAGRTEAEIPIVFTGLRPGEKLFEDLHSQRAGVESTGHPKLWRVHEPTLDAEQVAQLLLNLKARVQSGDATGLQDWLLRLTRGDAAVADGPTAPAWRELPSAS